MSEMYDRIASLCKQKGITPSAMCKEIGVSRSLMTDMKAGRTKVPSAKNSGLIAEYLGVSVEYLLNGEEEKPTVIEDDGLGEYLEVLKNRPECRMLFQLAKGATKEEVEQAVKIIEALRK